MTATLSIAALWVALALIAGLLSYTFRVSAALMEILIGVMAQLLLGSEVMGADASWIKFLSTVGAVLLTFLAGAEIEPAALKAKWKEAGAVGFASFLAPFLLCAAGAHYFLGWGSTASWLAGLAMSTTSAAVVYAVMLEFGFNKVEYGKTLLISTFVTDVATVLMLGLTFTPFTIKTAAAVVIAAGALYLLPRIAPLFFKRFGGLLSELETKFILLCLLGGAALATWAESEAVLGGYLVGMVLAGSVGGDHALMRRLRTVTFGLLTPFFFILVGSLVSVPALIAAPAATVFFFIIKVLTKTGGIFPVAKYFGSTTKEAMYTSLLMSTGLTFGTIAALFGLKHGIIDASQYSSLVAAVITTAVIPTIIANLYFLPTHLLPKTPPEVNQ
jgi:glutathione-regulated potassium-efflux system ancillary protein KefC